jgi:hypothetical protein
MARRTSGINLHTGRATPPGGVQMNRQVRQLVLIAVLLTVALAAALRAEPAQAGCGGMGIGSRPPTTEPIDPAAEPPRREAACPSGR